MALSGVTRMAVTDQQLRAMLESQRADLQAELAHIRVEAGNGMGYSTHQADDASTATEQAADHAMRQNAERLLYEVERALKRMDDGTYGICKKCGQPIDRARLEIAPYARFCVTCATLQE